MKKQLSGFGMVMTGLIVLVTLAVVGALGWFGFKWLQENVFEGSSEQDAIDKEAFDKNLEGCIDTARKIKGTGMSYTWFKARFPFCASIVTLKIWNGI